jgi:FkbM family methyltransferase
MKSYSLHNLDILMLEYLDYENGFFIEVGANDGIEQSNTCMYEKYRNWKGLLVEPNPIKFSICKNNRTNSIVENYALVSSTYEKSTISGDFLNEGHGDSLMAMVVEDGDYQDEDILRNRQKRLNSGNIVDVPAITLTKLLDKHQITKIDFFSLDVEGYEMSVLNGLDFSIYRPKYILVETANRVEYQREMKKYMESKNYSFIKQLSGNDDLFVDNRS